MKNSLEYKVLKYLSDNDVEENVDITNFFKNDIRVARRTLKALRDDDYIYYFERAMPYGENGKFFGKIKFKGQKYLETLKPQPIPKYQKIYLPIFILFGFSAMILGILNYNSNRKNDVLKSEVDSLTTESRIYKDSVGLLKSQIELYKQKNKNGTLKTKN